MKPAHSKNRKAAAGSVLAENPEPLAGPAVVPIWLFVLLGLLIYWAQLYLDRFGGGFNPLVYEPYPSFTAVADLQPKSDSDAFAARGKDVYQRTCMLCHQPNGEGTAGQFPPLASSEWVNAQGPNRIIRIVLDGLSGPMQVKGVDWSNTMVPWRGTLSDEDIAAAITYVRQEWGNKAGPVTPEQVKTISEQTQGHAGQPWNAADLLSIPEGP